MLMNILEHFAMNKHETLSKYVRFGIYFHGKLCLKYIDFRRR